MVNVLNVIKKYRVNKGLSQKELSELLGKSKNVVSNWENGVNKPDVDTIERLCEILDIPISEFFGNNEMQILELSREEEKLVLAWRKLTRTNKNKILGMIEMKIDEN